MISHWGICRFTAIVAVLGMAQSGVISAQPRPQSAKDAPRTSALSGQQTFSSTCAGCHGLDGGGGERAPSIARNPKVQRLSDAQISRIISNGVPGTGMPPFHSMSSGQIRSVVSYLRVLQGTSSLRALPGDARRGREVFFGKGECSTCHTFRGEGGFFGPDLTNYGSTMSAKAILESILDPARVEQFGYKPAAVITRDGKHVEGLVRNEDNFSIQLLTKDGTFYFFQRSDLQSLEYPGQSFMPADYGARLTRSELNDLVSYLMGAHASARPPRTHEE